MSVVVGPAPSGDLPGIPSLLGSSGLPGRPRRPSREHAHRAGVGQDLGQRAGRAAWPPRAPALRCRGRGTPRGRLRAGRLTREALELARSRRAQEAFLRTEMADAFFVRPGFGPVARTAVLEPVRGSVEFVSACPASAGAISADLRGDECR